VIPDRATTPVPAHVRAAIEAAVAQYPDYRSAAIPALHIVQREHGWCSPTAIEQAACVMRVTPAYLTAVATFYDMFSTTPKGRHDVFVCTNISCSMLGADAILEEMQRAAGADPDFHVKAFECLGACDIAPMASVDGEYVGPLVAEDCDVIVDDVRAGREVLPGKQLKRRKIASEQWREA
jgi:NADH:ubiquinone oxidoreductase subunit E